MIKGFSYTQQKPVQFKTGRELGKFKRDYVSGGGRVQQVTTRQGKELWFKGSSGLEIEVYL